MFEESILADSRRSSRWSMPLSLAIQLTALCLLLLFPMIYGERLPFAPPPKAAVYLAPAPREPQPVAKPAAHSTAVRPRMTSLGIVAPSHIPPSPVIIHDDAPYI